MKENEILLFKQLCKFKSTDFDESLIEYASPKVLGHLFYNRMQGIAFLKLKNQNLLGKTNREFRNSLKCAYEQNIERNNSFKKCLLELSQLLANCENIAMLKGAVLCSQYPEGCRTSNDIDLLVLPSDVTKIGDILNKAGFKQGNIRNDAFIPATRKEIIESKIMRGETVPYIKQVDLPYMKYFEVDINFSLDYKNGNTDTLEEILKSTTLVDSFETLIPSLNKEDFFIHLCAHLYKEATTLPWIEMHRDMTLYKYCDIYMLLNKITDIELKSIFAKARKYGMEKMCAYAILETMDLFEIDAPECIKYSCEAIKDDPLFTLKVVDPKGKRTLCYKTANSTKRFFMENRIDNLVEVK